MIFKSLPNNFKAKAGLSHFRACKQSALKPIFTTADNHDRIAFMSSDQTPIQHGVSAAHPFAGPVSLKCSL